MKDDKKIEEKRLEENSYFEENQSAEEKTNLGTVLLAASIFALALVLFYTRGGADDLFNLNEKKTDSDASRNASSLEHQIAPLEGAVLPVKWGNLGVQLTKSGVINGEMFKRIYADRGGMTPEMMELLEGEENGDLKVTSENAGYILNLLWALGLGQKSDVLDKGPMTDPKYGGAASFASTGGWNLSDGNTMAHYSKHSFFNLSEDEEKLVEAVSKNIYRPCCGNSTYFPDCNHGMAMLGLLELMASQGAGETEMYKAALAVNSYWFPDTYYVIGQYMQSQGMDWKNVDPKLVLGEGYSSSNGIQKIQEKVSALQTQGQLPGTGRSAGGCGV